MKIKVRFWDEANKRFWFGGQEGESVDKETFQTYFKDGALTGAMLEDVSYGFKTVDDTWERELPCSQYTGLKDKEGNGIYEGDIVYQEFYDHRVEVAHGLTGVVKQEEGVWWIDNEVDDAVRLWSELNLNHIKGNVFENPELLQGGNK